MTLYEFLQKYGTHTASTTLRTFAMQLNSTRDAHGFTVDMKVVEELAQGLAEALTHFQNSNKPATF